MHVRPIGKQDTAGLRVAVTGAAGFIGRALVDRLARGALGAVAELRLNDVHPFERAGAEVVLGSYAEAAVRDRLVGGGVDVLFHLASLPGGAAERDPALGKTVNLDGSMAMLDAVVASATPSRPPTIVYASSIAALGMAKAAVNDATALRPSGSYGTHKAMVEFYLADLTRRGWVDGRSVRPAGIVARPRAAFAGFATAWMSELFHAAVEQGRFTIPAQAQAHVWLQSVDKVADNIVHAALMPAAGLSAQRAWTLPATVARIDQLIEALRRRAGPAFTVDHAPGLVDQPPLDARAALSVGFTSDGDTEALVDAVVSRLQAQRSGA